ncbi:uncharacterized protein LTR77_006826 [Saxophila tyrrhenica]|uniref:HTH La-type RNA-binding domain-containing protein n=1 Tax=Saxophila tyrrhenica TaxID=1690608 RepID=A0AAV9P604_9PEZI|nr:hypothetical protein LTR77_006826 [Saxophila tyrrhenica]
MAATTFSSPGGFSYAQAAKGRAAATASQTPSSKVTSGTATPATGTFSELTPGSNWADDVESGVKEKKSEPQPTQPEERKSSPIKDPAVEQAKSEDKVQQDASAVSSPDITASSSTTAKEDDSPAPHASSSDSTWETKSQASEPAWIAERTQRQSQHQQQQSEESMKHEKKGKDTPSSTPAKPVALQEAAPPTVNPWLKPWAAKPATPSSSPATASLKENQKPTTDAAAKPSRSAYAPVQAPSSSVEEPAKFSGAQVKRGGEARASNSRQGSKPVVHDIRTDSASNGAAKGAPNGRPSPVKASPAPPSVSDGVSWPTPDTAGKERKESVAKSSTEKREDDATPVSKRKKPEYEPLNFTPTFRYETTGTSDPQGRKPGPSRGDRPRGGGVRGGRGGPRGGMNGSERQASRPDSTLTNAQPASTGVTQDDSSARDREAMPPPPRPSSSDATQERKKQNMSERINTRKQNAMSTKQNGEVPAEPASATQTPNGTFSKPFTTTPRSMSPNKVDVSGKDEDVPKPIPRRTSTGTKTEEMPNGTYKGNRGPPPIRMVPTEGRKEHRAFGDSRDGAFSGPRGTPAKRSGRGRGGGREVPNGHPGASPYAGAHSSDVAGQFQYGMLQSPTSYHPSRGGHQYSHPYANRGPYRGNNTRSHSIPMEQYYNQPRYGGAYPDPQQAANLQAFFPGMFDNNGYPASPVPYPLYGDPDPVRSAIAGQLEYYFSLENLIKDTYLRRHMDSQGFVLLEFVASFPRMKQAISNIDHLRAVAKDSKLVILRAGEDGKERIRKKKGWEDFVMPMDQRDESAKTNGPEHLKEVDVPPMVNTSIPPQFRGPASAGLPYAHQRGDRRSYDSNHHHSPYNGYMYGEGMHPGHTNGVEAQSRNLAAPAGQQSDIGRVESNGAEYDAFPDDRVQALFVCFRSGGRRPGVYSAASRTFSNGSIDSRSALPDIDTAINSKSKPLTNGDSQTNGAEDANSLSRHMSPGKMTPGGDRAQGTAENENMFWVKDQDYPIDTLPQGLQPYPYTQLYSEAMHERHNANPDVCPPSLSNLYDFWSHFLIRNFNTSMYMQFKQFAEEDGLNRADFEGLRNLVKFYSQSLSSQNPIRDRVAKDYVDLVKKEPANLHGAAFKSLRSAWRNGALNLKNRKKLSNVLDDSLKEQLDKLDS